MTADLRERLGYTFRRPDVLAQALTHRSFGARHNERLRLEPSELLPMADRVRQLSPVRLSRLCLEPN